MNRDSNSEWKTVKLKAKQKIRCFNFSLVIERSNKTTKQTSYFLKPGCFGPDFKSLLSLFQISLIISSTNYFSPYKLRAFSFSFKTPIKTETSTTLDQNIYLHLWVIFQDSGRQLVVREAVLGTPRGPKCSCLVPKQH